MSAHLDELELSDYADDPEGHPRRAEIESHLAACDGCRETLNVMRSFDEEVDTDMVWQFADATRRRADTVPVELMAKAAEIDAEEHEARDYLRMIVMTPVGLTRAAILDTPTIQTAGMVRLLCETSRELRERNPKHALRLADEAMAVAERLPGEKYDVATRRELRASAWFERANVLRYLGDFTEALRSLDRSEAEYRESLLSDLPMAAIKYTRSVIYMKSERPGEAAKLAEESSRVFALYGENERVMNARFVMGCCLTLSGQHMRACDLFRLLLKQARMLDEPATVARCLSNLANAEMELGRFGEASAHLAEASPIYEQLGLRTEVLRTRWASAFLMLRMGNIADGLGRLRRTAGEMLALGLTTDHALVMLDATSGLFAVGELAELPAICAELVRVFTEAGMPENARMALGYLAAAVSEGAVSEPLIESVKTYIEREEYAAPFVPPA